MQKLFSKLDISDPEMVIEFGTAATEIVRYAEEQDIDLIVIGRRQA